MTSVPTVNLFSQVNSGSRMRCWSWTSPTPGAPVNELVTTANLVGSLSCTRKLSGRSAGLMSSSTGLSLNCCLNRL